MNNTPRNLSKAGVALLTGLALSFSANAAGSPDDFARGCSAGKGNDCFKLGEAYLRGSVTARDFAKAKASFEKACSLKDGMGCRLLSVCYALGNGTSKNLKKGHGLYDRASSRNDGIGCANAGFDLSHGVLGSTDYAGAKKYFEKGCCQLKSGESCKNLGVLYEFGYGVSQDLGRARDLYQQSCSLGEQDSCRELQKLQ